MNHIVSGCKDCCFLNHSFNYEEGNLYHCNHPTIEIIYMELDSLEQIITPLNCPLKKENITIVFDSKD